VSGPDFDSDWNAVEMYARDLRGKIGTRHP
jgi:hypothetical protein